MKTTYKTNLVLAIATVVLFTALPCQAVEKEDKPQGHRGFELTDERIERMLERLEEVDPEKAEDLSKLRKENLQEFKAELRKAMHEQFGRRFSQRRQHREGRMPRGLKPDMRFGHRDRPGGPGRRQERWGEYLEWLEKNYPEKAGKLAKLKEKKPNIHMRQLRLGYDRYGKIFEAARENPKLAEVLKEDLELRDKRGGLLRKIETASNDEKKELNEELKKVVSSRFDLIIRRRQIKYEHLRKRLERLKERIKRSQAQFEKYKNIQFKNENVKVRLEELIGRTEKFNWD